MPYHVEHLHYVMGNACAVLKGYKPWKLGDLGRFS